MTGESSTRFLWPCSSFSASAQAMAERVRTQPDWRVAGAAAQRAVDWVEYVVGGSDCGHLQSPLVAVSFRMVYSVDIILAILSAIIGFCIILFKHLVLDKMCWKSTVRPVDKKTETPLAAICEEEEGDEGGKEEEHAESDKKNS